VLSSSLQDVENAIQVRKVDEVNEKKGDMGQRKARLRDSKFTGSR